MCKVYTCLFVDDDGAIIKRKEVYTHWVEDLEEIIYPDKIKGYEITSLHLRYKDNYCFYGVRKIEEMEDDIND